MFRLLALLAASSSASFIELQGADSEIVFHGRDDGHRATLTASCPDASKAATFTWVSPRLGGIGGLYKVGLGNVAMSCAHVADLREPCVADSGGIPPTFYCQWTNAAGTSAAVGPVVAHRELDTWEGVKVAVRVTAMCPGPPESLVTGQPGFAAGGSGAPVTLSMAHFAAPGDAQSAEVAFKGVAAHDVVLFFEASPPSPPPPSPPPPVSPPPASPPPTGLDCRDIKLNHPATLSGEYEINPTGSDPVRVWCDMDTDSAHGYTVIARFARSGCCTEDPWSTSSSSCVGGCTSPSSSVNYFTTSAIGIDPIGPNANMVINNDQSNSDFGAALGSGALRKMDDIAITALIDLRRSTDLTSAYAGHRIKWYTRGEASNEVGGSGLTGWTYFRLHSSQTSFTFQGTMEQHCTRQLDSGWTTNYKSAGASPDQGLTGRSTDDPPAAGGNIRCYYTKACNDETPNPNRNAGCTDNSQFMTFRHSTNYHDICGRRHKCSATRHVVMLIG